MPKRNDWSPGDSDQAPTSKLLKECALGIGQAAIAWNHLHEELRGLFCELFSLDITINTDDGDSMGIAQYRRLYRLVSATWNSIGFDRPKRGLLKDVLGAISSASKRRFPALVEDVNWILKEATSLEDSRNDLIHSPIGIDYLWRAEDMSDMRAVAVPRIYGGNHRALKLMEKDLQAELIYCRDMAIALKGFANDISSHIAFLGVEPPQPWPKRPQLPTRGQKSSRRGRLRRGAQEALSPQDRKHRLEVARRLKQDD